MRSVLPPSVRKKHQPTWYKFTVFCARKPNQLPSSPPQATMHSHPRTHPDAPLRKCSSSPAPAHPHHSYRTSTPGPARRTQRSIQSRRRRGLREDACRPSRRRRVLVPSCPSRRSSFPARPRESADVLDGRGRRRTHHAQAHPLVRVDEVGQVLGRGGHRYPLAVSELVQSALDTQVGLPVLAIRWIPVRRASAPPRHHDRENAPAPPAIVPSKNALISITFFTVPDAAGRTKPGQLPAPSASSTSCRRRTDVAPSRSTRIDSNNDPAFEPERERRGTVVDLDAARGV